jgi:hypothetical protein
MNPQINIFNFISIKKCIDSNKNQHNARYKKYYTGKNVHLQL